MDRRSTVAGERRPNRTESRELRAARWEDRLVWGAVSLAILGLLLAVLIAWTDSLEPEGREMATPAPEEIERSVGVGGPRGLARPGVASARVVRL